MQRWDRCDDGIFHDDNGEWCAYTDVAADRAKLLDAIKRRDELLEQLVSAMAEQAIFCISNGIMPPEKCDKHSEIMSKAMLLLQAEESYE